MGLWLMLVLAVLVGASALAYGLLIVLVRPSLNRRWSRDHAVLPRATFVGNSVMISSIRNFNYRSTTDYDVQYYDKTFDLEQIESVWYMVEPFAGHTRGVAHTLVSFGFAGGDYVAFSIEARREVGEEYSVVKGLFRQYELIYVIADERDVIKLRSNFRNDDVFLYPGTTDKDDIRGIFVSMVTRAERLAHHPEFYNTLTNSCTTNIVAHINELAPGKVPMSYKIILPGYSDELAREICLIDHSLSIEALRATYRINERAKRFADDPNFSQRIRA